ncbi:unnamed protein product [Urochloa humidicola]
MLRFLALIIITVAVVSCSHACAMDSHAADRAALLSFKSGVRGNLSDWASLRMCNWTGVTCDLRGRVIRLSLSHSNLTGLISPSIGNLSALGKLELGNNYLFGSLPPELGKLSWLEWLGLDGNLLEGAIPHTLGLLKRMACLNLFSNNLSGDIPEAIFCNCSSLIKIYLSDNSLSGVIPVPIRCRLPYIEELSLSGNRLVGIIPSSILNLTSLQIVGLSNNFPWWCAAISGVQQDDIP